ncbi:hypothetical protein [Algoriphagus persicinus]|uniref:hypothetical protein n=1 Tax=Algoriphagus persicinus TaxID=3108754 RepID=UPI002B3D394E|nr:hypothetical protein [Algoriphagus sp. E1-3-M2]MEB2783779.1 hypothetical protein [Algoriphagus sp. E1-3-M2]
MDIVIKGQSDFHKLFHIILKPTAGECVTIHLYQAFLRPMDILVLTEFIISQLNTIGEVNLKVENQPVRNYLKAIGLFEFCSKNHFAPSEIFEIPSYTAMPIRRVNRETMNYYIQRTQAFFQTLCQDKDLGVLGIALSELINNVHDHAKSSIDAYVFCQYYPRHRIIILAVADLGFGIPFTVNKYLTDHCLSKLSQIDAVEWALKINKTTQSKPYNAGKGLDTISSFVTANKGQWKLFSGEVKMQSGVSGNQFFINPIQNFVGTVIEISIKVDNLSHIETVDFLDW